MKSRKFSEILLKDKVYEIITMDSGLKTGLIDLDYVINGLRKGALYVLGGRPAIGKTAFAFSVIHNLSVKHGKKVFYVSLDNSYQRIVARMIQTETGINIERRGEKTLNESKEQILNEAIGRLERAPIIVEDNPAITIEELGKLLQEKTELQDIDLIVVDYLQLIGSELPFQTRQEEVSYVCLQLKQMSKELNVPILVLSALSRAVEQRPDHRPMLSDLRDSGSIEQYADVVMFLYRDRYYMPDFADRDVTEVIVRKNNYGPVGYIELHFSEERGIYQNYMRHMD